MELTRKQEEALKIAVDRYKHGEKYTIISGYAGSGKAQPIDTIIPTPNGNKKLGELQVGDYVFDRVGNPTRVLGVFPQSLKKQYKVILSDGRETICAGDHLWSYYTSKGKLISKTAQDMLKSGLKNSGGFKYKIPTNKPVQYPTKQYKLDPYFMGAFLGDGCCKERYLTISSETAEIPEMLGTIIDAKPIKNSKENYSWTFEWNNETKITNYISNNNAHRSIERKKPKTLDYFNEYKDYLIQYAYEKDIPPEYKYGDIEQRLSLVQGLMDTDGSINGCDEHRYNMRFTSTSLKLVMSLQEILFSLGYSSTLHIDNREEKYTNHICYDLSINVSNTEKYKFFRLKRKKEIALEAQKYIKRKDYSKISIINIEPLEEATEMVCIYVDNLEHLYLTTNYIVTHNTTLTKFIIAALGVNTEECVAYVALTGKAALVLRQKGCPNATTAHKLLYRAIPTRTGEFRFEPKPSLGNIKVVVCDEISMLPRPMWEQLMRHKVYVIGLGDPMQLPPIYEDDNNHLLDHPHIFLDEIMRQALDSEIIRFSMWVREGKDIKSYSCDNQDVKILKPEEVNSGVYMWGDQILCATNNKRTIINNQIRQIRGFGKELQIGDKVISLRNHWDYASMLGAPLTNGTIGYITDVYQTEWRFPYYIIKNPVPMYNIAMTDDIDDEYECLWIDKTCLETGESMLTPKLKMMAKNNKNVTSPIPYDFAYAYCMTVHKAQGSQWDKVVVLCERFPWKSEDRQRWLYTSCTRAAEKLVIVTE